MISFLSAVYSGTTSPTGGGTVLSFSGTAPANGVQATVSISGNNGSASSSFPAYFNAFYCRRLVDGNLIVDGGITAKKITAGTITTSLLAADAIKSTNYAETGSAVPVSGFKADVTGTTLKVAANGLQVGANTLEQMFSIMAASNWQTALTSSISFRSVTEGTGTLGTDVPQLVAIDTAASVSRSYVSYDVGRTWQTATLPVTSTWYNVISGGPANVMLLGFGVVVTSSNISTWGTATLLASTQYLAGVWDGTAYVLLTNAAVNFARSTTGANGSWTSAAIISGTAGYWKDVSFSGSGGTTRICAVGQDASRDVG